MVVVQQMCNTKGRALSYLRRERGLTHDYPALADVSEPAVGDALGRRVVTIFLWGRGERAHSRMMTLAMCGRSSVA